MVTKRLQDFRRSFRHIFDSIMSDKDEEFEFCEVGNCSRLSIALYYHGDLIIYRYHFNELIEQLVEKLRPLRLERVVEVYDAE